MIGVLLYENKQYYREKNLYQIHTYESLQYYYTLGAILKMICSFLNRERNNLQSFAHPQRIKSFN